MDSEKHSLIWSDTPLRFQYEALHSQPFQLCDGNGGNVLIDDLTNEKPKEVRRGCVTTTIRRFFSSYSSRC